MKKQLKSGAKEELCRVEKMKENDNLRESGLEKSRWKFERKQKTVWNS